MEEMSGAPGEGFLSHDHTATAMANAATTMEVIGGTPGKGSLSHDHTAAAMANAATTVRVQLVRMGLRKVAGA